MDPWLALMWSLIIGVATAWICFTIFMWAELAVDGDKDPSLCHVFRRQWRWMRVFKKLARMRIWCNRKGQE